MNNEWISHDRTSQPPEGVRGLLPATPIEVEQSSGVINTFTIGEIKNWPAVVKWRRVATQSVGVQTTLNERGKTHGDFTTQAVTAQTLKNNLRVPEGWQGLRDEQREALETICMKISRILHGNPDEPDHWRDIAGYATLVENILVHGKSHLG